MKWYGYLRVEIVVLPERSEFVLSAHIPDGELDVPVFKGLHVESDGGDGRNEFVLLQLEEEGRLTRPVQAQGHHPHLDLGPDVDAIVLKRRHKFIGCAAMTVCTETMVKIIVLKQR